MFRTDHFIACCRAAVAEGPPAIRDIVREAVADPAGIFAELGEPVAAGLYPLYRGPDVTVLNFVWAPCMMLFPHNHSMSSTVGIYSGREDNIFWRRIETGATGPRPALEAAGAVSLGPGDVTALGRDVIHSVANPIGKMTCALHVYGGDFFDPPQPRSQWDHETLVERPWDVEDALAVFRAAETRFRAVPDPDAASAPGSAPAPAAEQPA